MLTKNGSLMTLSYLLQVLVICNKLLFYWSGLLLLLFGDMLFFLFNNFFFFFLNLTLDFLIFFLGFILNFLFFFLGFILDFLFFFLNLILYFLFFFINFIFRLCFIKTCMLEIQVRLLYRFDLIFACFLFYSSSFNLHRAFGCKSGSCWAAIGIFLRLIGMEMTMIRLVVTC